MPRIRLKPNSPEYADPKQDRQPRRQHCEMPGCTLEADYKAPKDRGLSDYYRFCFEHVKEYNNAWNFFSGMSDTEVEKHMTQSLYGDRPTRRYDMPGAGAESLRRKAWQTYHFTEEEPPRGPGKNGQGESGGGAQTPEFEALAIMGLKAPVTLAKIKARYKTLVKMHHPDANQGSKASEELLKSINMAYTILKMAYQAFESLPQRE